MAGSIAGAPALDRDGAPDGRSAEAPPEHLALASALGAATPPGRRSLRSLHPYVLGTALFEPDGSTAECEAKWLLRWEPVSGRQARLLTLVGELDLPGGSPGDRIRVIDASSGERSVSPRVREVVLGQDFDVVFEGDLPAQAGLRVVDGRTGEDLSEVRIVPWTCSDSRYELPPVAAQRDGCGRVERPPLSLPGGLRHRAFWIGADGYAWRRIRFGAASSDPLYALEPGGGVRILAEAPSNPGWSYHLRVRGLSTGTSTPRTLTQEPLTASVPLQLDGLLEGTHRIDFIARDSEGRETTVLEREVTVAAGEVTELAVDLGAGWNPREQGRIRLDLLLEDPADRTVFEVEVTALDPETSDTDSTPIVDDEPTPGLGFVWLSGWRPLGRHRVRVLPGTAEATVEVESGSKAWASLRVPALPKLSLWFTDAGTGAAVEGVDVYWREQGRDRWRAVDASLFPSGAPFPVALGPIEVALRAPGYRTLVTELEIHEAWNEELLDLTSVDPRDILVRLQQDGHAVPIPTETWTRVAVLDAGGEPARLGVRGSSRGTEEAGFADGASAWLTVDGPGAYSVSLPEIPGFEPPAAHTVVVADEPVVLDVELRPVRRD